MKNNILRLYPIPEITNAFKTAKVRQEKIIIRTITVITVIKIGRVEIRIRHKSDDDVYGIRIAHGADILYENEFCNGRDHDKIVRKIHHFANRLK